MIGLEKCLPHGRSRRSQTTGQSLVEFALIIPIFMFTLFGLIDVARFVYLNTTISQAAREGARVGSVEASYRGSSDAACGKTGGPVCPSGDSTLLADITAGANRMMTPFGSVAHAYMSCVASTGTPPSGNWTSTACPSNSSGGTISVRVTVQFTPITPILSDLLGVTLSGSTSMAIN